MSFYYQKEEMGIFLKEILYKISNNRKNFLIDNIAITWINYSTNINFKKGFGCGINQKKQYYPASIVKLVYGLAIYDWIEKKRVILNKEIENAVFNMLQYSSNDATSFLIDLLTGTTSGLSIEGVVWDQWKYQREIINDWLIGLGWDEVKEFNCCQKTWDDGPYGREKDFYGQNNQNRNSMSAYGTAKILEEIIHHKIYNQNNLKLKDFLFRNLAIDQLTENENQVKGFLGEGLPDETPFWSKAGLMSKARHDAAWWLNNQSSQTLLVVFGNGQNFANDTSFLPEISHAIYTYNQQNLVSSS